MSEEQIKRLNAALDRLCPDTIDMLVDNWIDTVEQIDIEEDCD